MRRPVAVITGGTSRIGSAISLALASRGYDIVILYHAAHDKADELVARLTEQYASHNTSRAVDLRNLHKTIPVIASAIRDCGRVDLLVNNASIFQATPFPFKAKGLNRWKTVVEATFWGTTHCCNIVAPLMKRQAHGHIINIADVYGETPLPGYGAHCVAKAAILALTRQLAIELAPTIRVNAISPGPITPPVGQEKTCRADQGTLLQRWGGPSSVAKAVLYLDDNDFVTGEVLTVDGGKRYA